MQNSSNRPLLAKIGILLVLNFAVIGFTGCPGTEATLTVVDAALASSAAILKPLNPNLANGLTAAATDINTLNGLVAQYQAAAAANKPGIAGQIQALAGTITANLGSILNAVNVSNPTLEVEIAAGVAVANTLIQAYLALLPTATTAPTSAQVVLPTVPGKISAASLKSYYNKAVKPNHPEAVIK